MNKKIKKEKLQICVSWLPCFQSGSYYYTCEVGCQRTEDISSVMFLSQNKKCPYSEYFWSTFSRIWTEYGDLQSKSPNSVRMRENADQENSEYGHFLGCVYGGTI